MHPEDHISEEYISHAVDLYDWCGMATGRDKNLDDEAITTISNSSSETSQATDNKDVNQYLSCDQVSGYPVTGTRRRESSKDRIHLPTKCRKCKELKKMCTCLRIDIKNEFKRTIDNHHNEDYVASSISPSPVPEDKQPPKYSTSSSSDPEDMPALKTAEDNVDLNCNRHKQTQEYSTSSSSGQEDMLALKTAEDNIDSDCDRHKQPQEYSTTSSSGSEDVPTLKTTEDNVDSDCERHKQPQEYSTTSSSGSEDIPALKTAEDNVDSDCERHRQPQEYSTSPSSGPEDTPTLKTAEDNVDSDCDIHRQPQEYSTTSSSGPEDIPALKTTDEDNVDSDCDRHRQPQEYSTSPSSGPEDMPALYTAEQRCIKQLNHQLGTELCGGSARTKGASSGCIKLTVQARDLDGLKDILQRFEDGRLQKEMKDLLLTDEMKKAAGNMQLEIEVKIDVDALKDKIKILELQEKVAQGNETGRISPICFAHCKADNTWYWSKPSCNKGDNEPTYLWISVDILEYQGRTPAEKYMAAFERLREYQVTPPDNGEDHDRSCLVCNGKTFVSVFNGDEKDSTVEINVKSNENDMARHSSTSVLKRTAAKQFEESDTGLAKKRKAATVQCDGYECPENK